MNVFIIIAFNMNSLINFFNMNLLTNFKYNYNIFVYAKKVYSYNE